MRIEINRDILNMQKSCNDFAQDFFEFTKHTKCDASNMYILDKYI